MKRLTRIIAGICMAVLLATSVSGCKGRPDYEGYQGAYPGAYTLIYSQVPDIQGVRTDISWCSDPQIVLLDTDDMGRALYVYLENTYELLSIGIVQKETGDKVYFYPEESTLSCWIPDRYYEYEFTDAELLTLLYELFPNERIEALKAMNDWGKPIKEEKLDSEPIITPPIEFRFIGRTDSVNLSKEEWDKQTVAVAQKNGHEVTHYYEGCISHCNYAIWMATDDYGRRLYYVEGEYTEYPVEDNDPHINCIIHYLEMIAIINPDGSFNENTCMVELMDKTNYQEQLRELKAANGWNQPLE